MHDKGTQQATKASDVRFDKNGRPIVRTNVERAVARPVETRAPQR